MSEDASTLDPSTVWQLVTAGTGEEISQALLALIQSEAGAAQGSANAAAASALGSEAARDLAAASAIAAANSAVQAALSAAAALAGGSGSGSAGQVPFYISTSETYTVGTNKQALFARAIEVDGNGSLVIDGILIEVD